MQVVRTTFTPPVMSYLEEHHTVVLSTSSFTGMPHANTALYVHDDHNIYFLARSGSILLKNLHANQHAAFTIDDYTSQWGKHEELHGEGSCKPLTEADQPRIRALWSDTFGTPVPNGTLCELSLGGLHFIEYDSDSDVPAAF